MRLEVYNMEKTMSIGNRGTAFVDTRNHANVLLMAIEVRERMMGFVRSGVKILGRSRMESLRGGNERAW